MSEAIAFDEVRAWVTTLLAHRGAVVEPQPGGAVYACLPGELQQRLALPEAAMLRILELADRDEIAIPLEGAALQACLDLALARGALAAARLVAPVKKHANLHAVVGQALQIDNAAVRPADVRGKDVRWLVLEVAFVAAADERSTGSVFVAHEPTLGASSIEVSRSLLAHLADAEPRDGLPSVAETETALRSAWPIAQRAVRAATLPFERAANERFAREQRRLASYYDKLLVEGKRRRGRAADPAARENKLAAIERDREQKRHELSERFAIRCAASVASVLALSYETKVAEFVVRRKTQERTVAIAWDPWLRAPVARSCEACGHESRTFHACDDAVHLVCLACKGSRCKVCERGR